VQNPGVTIVTIAPHPDKGMTFVDVIIGSFGITAIAIVVAAVFGAILAVVLIRWNRRHPPENDRLPSVNPLMAGPTQSSSKLR
jgi:ABC-type phosphate transport system permease subunit